MDVLQTYPKGYYKRTVTSYIAQRSNLNNNDVKQVE